MNIIETKRGLPNNDALTAQPIEGSGYARNVDEARSGIIFATPDNLMQYHYPPEAESDDFLVIDRVSGADDTPELIIKVTDAAARLMGERHISKQEVAEYFESNNLTMKMVREYLDRSPIFDDNHPDNQPDND